MKTIERRKLNPALMGCKTSPGKVIDGGHVYQYVGIGWVDEGEATEADRKKYPVVVENKPARKK